MELPAVGNFIERPILHDPADINRSAECCHDKTDVAGNEVIGIEDGAIQYSNIGERSIAQNAGKVAEDESEDQCSVDGIDVEEAELFMQHRDDDLIDGNGGSQGGNDEQQEEHNSEEIPKSHVREGNGKRLKDERRTGIRAQAGAEKRRENHEASQNGDQRVDDAGNDGGLHLS